jgi:RNA polymerase sigma factor (sigma-70 family)
MTHPSQSGSEIRQEAASGPRGSRISMLVRAAASGNQGAWEGLVNEFSPLVLGVARAHRLSEADASDVAQTTWLRLVEHLERIEDPDRVCGWLATTAWRESVRVLRRASKQIVTEQVPEPTAEEDVAQTIVTAERDAAMREAFHRLRGRDQALLRLLVADPAPSYEQIGEILQMPVGSIGPTRARSLTRLRREAARVGLTQERRRGTPRRRRTTNPPRRV